MGAVATLYVRNVPADVYAQLQAWANASGRSVNAEVLAILEREAAARQSREGWLEDFLDFTGKLGLTKEDADLAIQSIRDHRDA